MTVLFWEVSFQIRFTQRRLKRPPTPPPHPLSMMEKIHGEKVPLDSRHRDRFPQTQGHPIREVYTACCRHTKPSGNVIDRGYSKWIFEEGHMQRLRTFYRYLQKLPVFSLSPVETNQPSPRVIVSGLLGSLQPLEPQLGRWEQALPDLQQAS